MTWLGRTSPPDGEGPEGEAPSSDVAGAGPPPRRSPGLAALFDVLHADGRHSILDLGTAEGRKLRLLGRYGRVIRFAGLLPHVRDDATWLDALCSVPPHATRPYDVALIWDLLYRLPPGPREAAVARIDDITAPGARLYAVVDATGSPTTRPLAFRPVDVDRLVQEPIGPPEDALPPVLPAQVERALSPFRVMHAFTLRSGFREYVAIKGG